MERIWREKFFSVLKCSKPTVNRTVYMYLQAVRLTHKLDHQLNVTVPLTPKILFIQFSRESKDYKCLRNIFGVRGTLNEDELIRGTRRMSAKETTNQSTLELSMIVNLKQNHFLVIINNYWMRLSMIPTFIQTDNIDRGLENHYIMDKPNSIIV